MKKVLLLIAVLAMAVSFCVGCNESADHTHEYTYSFVEGKTPTEETRGEVIGTCSICGKTTSIVLPALTDTIVWSLEERAATCVEKSAVIYTAKNYPSIQLIFEGEMDPTAHKLSDVAAKDATCTQDGNVAYAKCELCGKLFVDGVEKTLEEVTIKAAHKLTDVAAKDATCTEDGNIAYKKCSVCHKLFVDGVEKTLEEVTIKAAHKLTDVAAKDATCTEDGNIAYKKCSVCHKLFVGDEEKTLAEVTIPAGHNFVDGKCSRCGLAQSYGMAIFYAWTKDAISPSGTNYLVLDEKGEGDDILINTYSSYKNAKLKVELIDEATGRVKVTATYEDKISSSGSWGDDDDDYSYGDSESTYEIKTKYYDGYFDKASGIIIIGSSEMKDGKVTDFTGIRFMAPIASPDSLTAANFVTCNTESVTEGSAKPYTYIKGDSSYNVFIKDGVIYFGVSFADADGEALTAADMKTAAVFYVKNAEGEIIARYGALDGVIAPLDGYEGSYTAADKTLTLNGAGSATYDGATGTYEVLEDGTVAVSVTENDKVVAYYEVTLSGADATVEKPMVNVTLSSDYVIVGGQTVVSVNKNTVYTTETLANTDEMVFKGWSYQNGTEEVAVAVGGEIVVTDDMTLTAVWKALTVITITDSGYEGSELLGNMTLRANVGEVLYDILAEKYGVEYKGTLGYFEATFMVGENALSEDADIGEDDVEIEITVVWTKLPDYIGTYYGGELYNLGYGNNGGKTLIIDKEGNISGLRSGKVASYDEATQTVTWKSGSQTYKFYFDKEAKIILGIYSDNDISNDYYFLGQNLGTDGKVVANYGVYDYKAGSTLTSYYAQFIEAKTALGDNTIIFTYNNVIYSGVTIKNALGETLAVDKSKANSIAKATTVLVYKGDTLVYSRASAAGYTFADSTSSSKMTRALDSYFGTYTCDGKDNLTFDGTGAFSWGEKKGTYALTDEENSTFDLYVVSGGKNTEYHVVTLNAAEKTFVSEQPMVNIAFTTDVTPNESLIESVSVNKNIAYTLTVLTAQGYVFRGWLNGETLLTSSVTATQDLALTAKWDVEYTVTVVYNDGATENAVLTYGEGDTVKVDAPVWKAHRFDGWFTTATFDEGTEWAGNNKAISATVMIYAKWSDAEAYYNTYVATEVYGSNTSGKSSIYSRTYAKISIDAYGKAVGTGYPFSGNISIEDYDKATGELKLYVGSSFYKGYLNSNGIMILCYTTGDSAKFASVFFMNPFETVDMNSTTAKFYSSYWNGGMTRAISYVYDNVNYTVLVHNGMVYFDVQFKTALTGGEDVTGADCYTKDVLFVLDKDGNKLFKFAKDGDNGLAEVDEYEGEYTDATYGTVSLNGVSAISFGGNNGTYSKVEGSEGVFDVYMTESGKTVYYTLTVSLEEHTCELDKPMVTLTFDYNGVTPVEEHSESISVNKNVKYTLPSAYTSETHVLRGWYVSGDESKTLVTTLVPTENVSYVAKWAEKVVLTLVYGNGLENVVVSFPVGDSIVLADYTPAYTNGKLLEYWYESEDGGVTEGARYTAAKVTEAKTLYCKWIEKAPYEIADTSKLARYAFTYDAETGIWTSGNKGMNSSAAQFTITANTTITVTFEYGCSSEAENKWDYLHIDLNGTKKYTAGGKTSTITFKAVTITLAAGDVLEFIYEKDSSTNGGLDIAQIKDLKINGVAITEM